MRKVFNLICILLLNSSLNAQRYSFTAYVYDAESRQALEYVNIWVPSLHTGTISDKNGKFVLMTTQVVDSLCLSCIGYESIFLRIHAYQKIKVLLKTQGY